MKKLTLIFVVLLILISGLAVGCTATSPYPETMWTQDIIPGITNTYDLGSLAYQWRNFFIAGDITVGGLINGIDITTLAAGTVTSTATTEHIPYMSSDTNIANSSMTYDNLSGYIGIFDNTPSQHLTVAGNIFAGGDVYTDRWLLDDRNTFLGVGVVGDDNLAHTGGREGWENTIIGYEAGYDITTGYSNTVIGHQAGDSITTGYENTFVGADAGQAVTIGTNNVAVGDQAMMNVNDVANTVVGIAAMGTADGGYNTAVGLQTMLDSSGSGNTAIGAWAGQSNVGDDNVFLGYRAGQNNAGNDKLYIDNSNTATPLIYGDFSANSLTVYGDLTVTGKLNVPNLVIYANNAAAVAGGLVAGDFYRTGGDPDLVCVVH